MFLAGTDKTYPYVKKCPCIFPFLKKWTSVIRSRVVTVHVRVSQERWTGV